MEKHCHRCHRILPPETAIAVKGRDIEVCRECAEEKYWQCDLCHQYVCEQDLVDAESRSVCIWCLCNNFVLCPHCGSFVSTDNAVRFHGHWLCNTCREEYFRSCDGCHQKIEEDELEEIRQGGKTVLLCRACREGKYVLCDECREWFPAASILHWEGHTWCRECAEDECAVCDHCQKTVAANDIKPITVEGKELNVCSGCFRSQYRICDCCGDTFPLKAIQTLEFGNVCGKCLPKISEAIKDARHQAIVNKIDAAAIGIAAGITLGKALFKPPASNTLLSDTLPADDDGFSDDYVGDGLDGHDDYVGDGLDS